MCKKNTNQVLQELKDSKNLNFGFLDCGKKTSLERDPEDFCLQIIQERKNKTLCVTYSKNTGVYIFWLCCNSLDYCACWQTSVKYKHAHPHANTPKGLDRGCLLKGSLPKEWERERETDKLTEREQESPYIAHRKSCVRPGSALFGHGGFLAGQKTDISSAGWLLERGSYESLREATGVTVVGRQLGRARLVLWFQLQLGLLFFLLCTACSESCSLLKQTLQVNFHSRQ